MVETTDSVEVNQEPPAPSAPAGSRWPAWAWPALGAAAIVALLLSNFFLFLQLNDADDDIAALRESVDRVEGRIDTVAGAVSGAAADAGAALGALDQIDARVAAVESQPPSAAGTAVVGLPLFAGDTENDPALGTQVAEIGGFEYYLGQDIGFDLDDGRSRAIVVWAHWCSFCQEELPALSEWIEENAADLPNVEVISVTTSIDETAPNPLVPYLDENRFPFPVLVDETGDLARLLGVDAFPFWVFLGPDGSVLGRLAGLRGMEELGGIITQLDALATG